VDKEGRQSVQTSFEFRQSGFIVTCQAIWSRAEELLKFAGGKPTSPKIVPSTYTWVTHFRPNTGVD